MTRREWTTDALTADLAGKLRADRYLAAAEVMLDPHSLQRADLLAMPRRLEHGPMLIVEVKTSRADLLGDLRREKWRGYLRHGAVAFAFPAGLADPAEIPKEAGLLVRIDQGWSWKRSARLREAPKASDYLYRRMCLSAWDQSASLTEARLRPKAAKVWLDAKEQRKRKAAEWAQIGLDLENYRRWAAEAREECNRLQKEKWKAQDELRRAQALVRQARQFA